MLYNNEEFPKYMRTAGKVTIFTAVAGLFVFLFAFIFDVGQQEFSRVSAQQATTTLTVLNTPPQFVLEPYEVVESSTSSPTNSGDTIQWSAIGDDPNGAPYFLLVCSDNATPTANAASDNNSLGTAPPECNTSTTQWGVSAAASSSELATVSTTTTEAAPFFPGEINEWYAWVCDDDPNFPACNEVPSQGIYATSSSPFHVNRRPVLTDFYNDGPVDPGATITFLSTSSDPDTDSVGASAGSGDDDLTLIVCSSNSDYDAVENRCPNDGIASTTVAVTDDATAQFTIDIPTQDQSYLAYGYLVDEHGHEATANGLQFNFEVNNVAPFVLGGNIDLNGGADLVLTEPGAETPSSTLEFTLSDNNSCEAAGGGDEITDYQVSVFRTNNSTTTCSASGDYDPNDCYPSTVGQSVWDLTCTQTTACSGATSTDIGFSCEFPLWHIADPTDSTPNTPAALSATDWTAGVLGIDDNFATGTMATTSNPVDLTSFTSIGIDSRDIAYEPTAPGEDTGSTNASSSLQNLGNTGVDQEIQGEDMCDSFAPGNECSPDPAATIPADQQQFADTAFDYGVSQDGSLASTTYTELELNVAKNTSTSSPTTGVTYWGIAVPASITISGSYTGLNTFIGVTAEPGDWGI